MAKAKTAKKKTRSAAATVAMSFRVKPAIAEKLHRLAAKDRRSVSQTIALIVERSVARKTT